MKAYLGGWCAPMNLLYKEAIEQKLFVPMDPKLLVQMHYGSMVYLVKGQLHGNFEMGEDMIQNAIQACWKAVLLEHATTAS